MGCCLTLSGITRSCESSMGGIMRAWIACYDEVTTKTVTNRVITALADISAFKEYEFRKQTGSFTTTITVDDTTGTRYYSTDIIIQFLRQEADKHAEIAALAANDLVIVVEDSNGIGWFFGYDFPVEMSEGTEETGTAFGDFNGYNITLQGTSKDNVFTVSETVLNSLKGVTTAP